MSKSLIKIERGTTVQVIAKSPKVDDERYFTNSEKLTRYVKHLKRNYKEKLVVNFKVIRLN